ncbi:L-glutaminase [Stackebrandtia endophytica]|uniref:Glutaminase n=1 Tax=Stackebrandtia endophytica TaxID=1496996 RepID=A0A543AQ24_9ACTN|nr:L-glutaminase [Stackebrandtia endophytica]
MSVVTVDLQRVLNDIATRAAADESAGRVAQYIPALAEVEPDLFGIALAYPDGRVIGAGDWNTRFSIQSISKVFALALALAHRGEQVWSRVGREPSGNPFNSLVQLEYEQGIPRNPFINAGALAVTDELLEYSDQPCELMRDFLRAEARADDLEIDLAIADSESTRIDRNAALAHLMADYGNLRHPVPQVLHHYVRQCAISMSCRELALAGGLFTRHGLRGDGRRLLSPTEAKRISAIMLTCGAYDAAGEFAFRVGLPGKSGVSGGILAIVPGRYTLCVWSPGLDRRGNSVAGIDALDRFTAITGCSVF